MSENNENLQYNSCTSKGICSINPRTFALQNVLGLYMRMCAKYCIKLAEKDVLDQNIKDFMLNAIAISVVNPEFTEICFMKTILKLKEFLPKLISTYNSLYDENDFVGEDIVESDIFHKCEDIVGAIKFGESIFRNYISTIPSNIRDLFKIMMIVAKSISINILDIQSYDISEKEGFLTLLNLLNAININNHDVDELKNIIYTASECNTELMEKLHEEQEKRYGRQTKAKISYTTIPSKVILVVGSNIRELEIVLEAVKSENIDVYTHDDMMVAHTFPKFSEYKHLKGQYGHGLENCLIDFATFPGPIILTKHSLHNIESLYRGRLYTTDINFYKGVIKIESDDYSEVIKSAFEAKGFKTGKTCETVLVGYDFDECTELIEKSIHSGRYKKIVVIGLKDYSASQKNYFEKLIKHISDEVLIISFSYEYKRDNVLFFNTCFDSFAIVRIVKYLLKYEIPLEIFLPKCSRNTITEMIHFSKFNQNNVYMGECEPIMINPSLMNTLRNIFNIKRTGSVKKDYERINEL